MIGYFRFFITGVIFFLYSLVFFFVFLFRPFHPNNTHIMSKVGRQIFLKLLGIKLSIEIDPEVDKNGQYIYLGNHQTLLDVIIFGAICPRRTIVLGKKEIAYIPIFGQLFWLLGHFLVDRKNHDKAMGTMSKLKEKLFKKRASVLIMPEGTRMYSKGLGGFKKGAFRLAIDSRLPIVPIVVSRSLNDIDCSRWASGYVKAKILKPIDVSDLRKENMVEFIELTRNVYLKELNELSAGS